MATFQALIVALFISAAAFQSGVVHATISKSMYFNWGAQHSSMNGEDAQLVLDTTSGIYSILDEQDSAS